jgi:shikimate kinase
MNLKSKRVFIIGPGGVGKSTTGKLLAKSLGFNFIDLDLLFCKRIKLIPEYIKELGYKKYCEENSKLFDDILNKNTNEVVIALSSGFLVHEDSPELIKKHKKLLNEKGVSVLLLPAQTVEESLEIIIPRQTSRKYLNINEEKEKNKIRLRYPQYRQYGDIQIFSSGTPDKIVQLMRDELNKLKFSIVSE